MNEKLENLVANISYKNYELMINGAFFSTIISEVVKKSMLTDSLAIKSFNYVSAALYAFLVFSRLENYTKEMVTIKSAYGEVLDNYANLMNKFDLNNPIQISTMHANMVEDGYLSVNNKFKFDRKNVYDYNGINGANIINGHGVCRHYAALLSDLLNRMNIDAFNLTVCFPDYGLSIELLKNQVGQTREEIYANIRKYFINPDYANQIMEALDKLMEDNKKEFKVTLFNQKEKNIIKRILGNHAICFAVQNGYGYYLDPTMKRIYTMKSDDFGILCDDNIEEVKIKLFLSFLLNNKCVFDKMHGQVLNDYPSEDRETINMLVDDANKLYQENLDVCNQFYQENEEKYQTIAHNLSLLKTNIKSRK